MWVLKKQDEYRITAADMTFLGKAAKYILFDHKRKQDIMKELKTYPVLEK
jgi:hypothetical protein